MFSATNLLHAICLQLESRECCDGINMAPVFWILETILTDLSKIGIHLIVFLGIHNEFHHPNELYSTFLEFWILRSSAKLSVKNWSVKNWSRILKSHSISGEILIGIQTVYYLLFSLLSTSFWAKQIYYLVYHKR